MSRTYRRNDGKRRERRISVRAVRRDQPDLRKLSRALIAMAMAEAEAEADAQDSRKTVVPHDIAKKSARPPKKTGAADA
jgi:hypothetical protein